MTESSDIVVVQALAGAPFGGAENFYTRMVCALVGQAGIDQHAFTRANESREKQLREAGVPVQTFNFGGPFDLMDKWNYRKALKQLNPDIVLTYMNRASGLTPAGKGKYQLVCRLGHYYDLKYYRHADYWIGITKGICAHLLRGGMPPNKVVQIPNFADETPVSPLPRSSFNTPDGAPILLAAGRLHENKAFDVLLRALTGVPDAILWLAGEGPERAALEALALELKVDDRVRFLGWRDDVGALMATADQFVCPSRHEGLGSIIVESWFHNCPLVATNSQGPGELINHGKTGLITPVDKVEPLRAAINSLLQDPDRARQLASQASEHYLEHYAKAVIAQRYAEFFHRIGKR